TLKIEFGKLIPAVLGKNATATEIANAGLAAFLKTPDVPSVQFPVPSEVKLDRLFSEARNWTNAGDQKDASKMFEAIIGLYANTEISNVFTDTKQLKKTGDKIEIETNGRSLYSIGGLPLSWDTKVSGDLKKDGGKISL